jgi:hypothetical protein
MIIEYESVLYRIKENPIEHLGRRSVTEIRSYFMGYEFARQFWQQPELCRRISWERFREWFNSKVHLCRQNMQSFCLLLTEDEGQAFDLYFELYDAALKECKDDLIICNQKQELINPDEIKKTNTLIEFLFKAPIREKPALYFGNHRWISSLWAMCNGFIWAEKDMGIENSSDAINFELFQLWLDDRYPIAKGRNWDRLFDFFALHSESGALKEFYEHLEMFLEGDAPDATSKTIKEIVKNAKEQIEKEKDK